MSNKSVRKIKYAFRDGARFAVDAETAGIALEKIRLENGKLTAQDVVDESRPEDAPLHPVFEWDDHAAAEGYRRYQARSLIRSVRVVNNDADGVEYTSPAYVHVSVGDIPGYQQTTVVVERPDLYAVALADLQRKLESAKQSVDDLRRVAEASGAGSDRMTRIAIAVQAMQAASAAVQALH